MVTEQGGGICGARISKGVASLLRTLCAAPRTPMVANGLEKWNGDRMDEGDQHSQRVNVQEGSSLSLATNTPLFYSLARYDKENGLLIRP